MIVIVHQAVGAADPIVALVHVLECVQEVLSVMVILGNGLLLVAAGGHMVHPVRDSIRESWQLTEGSKVVNRNYDCRKTYLSLTG